jgi:hypothetical protein
VITALSEYCEDVLSKFEISGRSRQTLSCRLAVISFVLIMDTFFRRDLFLHQLNSAAWNQITSKQKCLSYSARVHEDCYLSLSLPSAIKREDWNPGLGRSHDVVIPLWVIITLVVSELF